MTKIIAMANEIKATPCVLSKALALIVSTRRRSLLNNRLAFGLRNRYEGTINQRQRPPTPCTLGSE